MKIVDYTSLGLEARTTNISAYVNDNDFGPFLKLPGTKTFDFTLLFEETILSILPSALLLLIIPPRILRLRTGPRLIKASSFLQTTKIALFFVFSVLQLANVIEVSRASLHTQASLAAAILVFAASSSLCALSYIEHNWNIRPSSIINTYLFLTLPFDAVQLRTRFIRGDDVTSSGLASAILAMKLIILVSEATEKKSLLRVPREGLSPEAISGIYSRGVFWWLNPIFRLGFRNVVEDEDLFATDSALLSSSLETKFAAHWKNKAKYPKKHTLVWIMLCNMIGPLLAGVLPRMIMTFFRFMQPFIIRNIIQLVNEPETPSTASRGWGLTAAICLVYTGLAISSGIYQHKANRVAVMVRGTLVNIIYGQTLDLSITALDESAAVTLMSSDVERICEALVPIHNIWASPIEVGLAIWLLQREIGLALFGPMLVTAVALTGPVILSKYMGKAQVSWIEGVQTRIDVTAKILQGMKGVKMLGLEGTLAQIVSRLRMNEILKSLKMRKLLIGMLAFGNMSDIFAPGAAFIIYVAIASSSGQTLDVTSAFTALSLIALLVAPIRAIVFATPPLIAAVSCFDRIESFLSLPTKSDHRLILPRTSRESTETTIPFASRGHISDNSEIELQEFVPRRKSTLAPSIIRINNLTLAWSVDGTYVVNDVSCEFRPGLTIILGPVGSGKSSLIQGILGETPSPKGQVYIDQPHAGYVAQAAWIQNTSIQRSIIGFSVFEPDWYASVIHACSLEIDIEAFADGDLTKVGPSGNALSGGQKLRLGLARAIYSREKVLILDDIFSGLDAVNEERIFARLLSKTGLLYRLGTTVILVTHAAHRLSYADYIVALAADGTVVEQGTFEALSKSDGYVAEFASHRSAETESTNKRKSIKEKPTEENTELENAAADLQRPVGNWEIYHYYFASVGLPTALTWLFLMVLYSVLMKFPDIWFKFWTSAIASHGNSVNGLYLGVLLAGEVVSIAILMSLTFILFVKMIPSSAKYFHNRLLTSVQNAPLAFFTTTDTGQIVNRFSQDLGVLDMELPIAGLILAFNFLMAIIQAIVICISTSYFAAVLPGVMVVMYLLQKFYLRTSRQIRLLDLEAKAPLYSNFLETHNGLVTVRAFGWQMKMKKKNMDLLDASQRPYYLLFCIQRWLALVVDFMVAALATILVALIVKFRRTADAGFVGVSLINIMSFSQSLSVLVMSWTAIETSLGAVQRIKSFVESTKSENLPGECEECPLEWPACGRIVLEGVTAAYALDQASALHNISLTILPGQRIGICGASGSGKSSFVALLLHMLEIQQGKIAIDNIDLSTISRQILRASLNVIPQEPVFFKGTIYQNLDPFCIASPGSAENVLKEVGLWSTITTAGGLDMPMEADELLSHGQRQLFCLARAMLKSSKILIIDEATASVDLETDHLMQKIIKDHFVGCTVIAVAHRLQTIRDFDRIVVFEEGRMAEYGAPDVLLADAASKFRTLWET